VVLGGADRRGRRAGALPRLDRRAQPRAPRGSYGEITGITQTVYRSMAGVMVVCLLVAIFGMRPGRAV
jgi:hypothetical protein